ncbi:hypothetical protein [Streptomyces scopuliridis]|uniref:hypothetical protein n=1 Tax=Streptomyces scopuliridis TaxID=452529 RepID=UPI00341B1D02
MTARQQRGRPVLFDDVLRDRYVQAVAGGMRLGEAAAHVGISANVPRLHARTDRGFAVALADAKMLGKKVRTDRVPHGESRYTNYGCRCRTCTTAATTARTQRRHQETEDTGGQLVELPAAGELSPPFSLARAS